MFLLPVICKTRKIHNETKKCKHILMYIVRKKHPTVSN